MNNSGFARLQRVVTLPVTYTTRGTLSINTGKGDGILDNLVIRTGLTELDFAITGSTIKGVVRSTIESILAAAEGDGKICVPMACAPLDENRRPLPTPGRKEDCGRQNRPQQTLETACSACQMFGNTSLKGRVIFHDAVLSPGTSVSSMQRTHVALTRNTGTASPRALTTLETVPAGVQFEGSIAFVDPEPWMVGGVVYTLKHIVPHTGVGAKKTSGYGELNVEPDGLQFELWPKDDTISSDDYATQCTREWEDKAQVQSRS